MLVDDRGDFLDEPACRQLLAAEGAGHPRPVGTETPPDLRLPGAEPLPEGGMSPPVLADPKHEGACHRPEDPPVFLG
jgi:hypothetical protein